MVATLALVVDQRRAQRGDRARWCRAHRDCCHLGDPFADRSTEMTQRPALNPRDVALAGHLGDAETARAGLSASDPTVRITAIGALERLGLLTVLDLETLLHRETEAAPEVRRRAAEAAAAFTNMELLEVLDDPDWSVVETACWALGEHEGASDSTLTRLIALATSHDEPLVREAAVAALGAIGDERGLPAILAATNDKPAVRRRAAVSLAPFDQQEAEAALARLLHDRDWQTRQIAEDLLDARPGAAPA